MSYKNKIGWGILSTGRISNWFCSDFHRVGDGKLVAVCSRSIDNAKSFAKTYDIVASYDDYDDFLSNPEIDVVYIGTPHTLHFENAKRALEAGKAVLCEKPLTVSLEEAKELTLIAQKNGTYLMEAMWTYFLPALQTAKSWLDDGRIGDLLHVKTDFGYPVPYRPKQREWDVELGGGVLLEMGIYPIAIADYFTDGTPTEIEVHASKAPNGVEQDVSIMMRYGKVTAMLGTSFLCRMGNAAQLIGTDGYIVIPDAFRASECHLYQLDELIESKIFKRDTAGYEYQAISVCKDLRQSKQSSEIMPLRHSLQFQQTIHAIKNKLA